MRKPKATMRPRRGKWYARYQYRNEYGQKTEIPQIPLRTTKKTVAYDRLAEVNKVIDQIIEGTQFTFPWMDEGITQTKIAVLTLSKAFEEYKIYQMNNRIKPQTIERSYYAIKTLTDVIGKSFPLRRLRTSYFDRYKAYWNAKHSANTINISLTKIKAFLGWCYKKGHISKPIEIEKVKAPKKPVSYISDQYFKEIMALDSIDNYYKRVFLFYRETGLRRSEPFNAVLDGNWLIVKAEKSKTSRERNTELNNALISIYEEIIQDINTPKKQNSRWADGNAKLQLEKHRSIQDRYSKQFKKACKEIGINRHFHNLRDTYAVRMWAITGDIYYVSKLIGHTSVTMTEKYADFNLRRLLCDFPTLAGSIKNRLKMEKFGKEDTNLEDTFRQIGCVA